MHACLQIQFELNQQSDNSVASHGTIEYRVSLASQMHKGQKDGSNRGYVYVTPYSRRDALQSASPRC